MNTFLFYFLLFLIYSFLGWLAEEVFVLIVEKKVSNRGFLIGFYCPIYGTAAILMHFFLHPFLNSFFWLFVITAIGVTILEYITSYLMEKLFKARWWDYSNEFLNFQGRICLTHTLMFGILGIVFIYFIDPFVNTSISMLPDMLVTVLSSFLLIVFIIDVIISFNVMHRIQITTDSIKKDYTDEINDKVKEFLLEHSFFTKRIIAAFPNFKIPNIVEIIKKRVE